jgi:23S rRNA pseudouridine1911/1915/1917 synthase
VLESCVPARAAGTPLLAWLAARFSYLDADGWERELAAGRVQRNGGRAAAADLVARHDRIAWRPPPAPPRADVGQMLLHVDPDFAVVDKPPHLVCHRAGAFAQNLFLPDLAARLASDGHGDWLEPVHRLDRGTSGVLLLARSAAAARALQQQFGRSAVAKEYRAVVHGVVAADAFAIDAPIGRDPASAIAARRAVLPADAPGARPARTEVAVVERFAAHTLLAVVPRTGRTHQIRVHLLHCGHPVVGDELYGRSDAEYRASVAHRKGFGPGTNGCPGAAGEPNGEQRQLLHSARLCFAHPRTGAALSFAAPVPADFAAFAFPESDAHAR